MHKGQKGLTLIELLIVVAILGIIAAVVIPNLGAFMVTGRISAANSEVENVKTASLAYYAENEVWPTTSAQLSGFLAGDLRGTYEFDALSGNATTYGWIIDGDLWDLHWCPGVGGEDGRHGRWARDASGCPGA